MSESLRTENRTAVGSYLENLDDDTLIYFFGFLVVSDIVVLRQTCRRMMVISQLRIVWHNVYTTYILNGGFPFVTQNVDSLATPELEKRTRRAIQLGENWLSPSPAPRAHLVFKANASNPITDIKFLPGSDGQWMFAISKGIWSVLSCWYLGLAYAKKMAEWSLKGAIFNGFVVNSDPKSPATIAISVLIKEKMEVSILSVQRAQDSASFTTVSTIPTRLKPMAFHGELIALSDSEHETRIVNWKTAAEAALLDCRSQSDIGRQYNKCLRVVFARKCIVVVRAHSVNIFPEPVMSLPGEELFTYQSSSSHSFGWMDGVAVTEKAYSRAKSSSHGTLAFLLRGERTDPWSLSPNTHTLNLHELDPSSAQPPSHIQPTLSALPPSPSYSFPPTLRSQVPSVRGLRSLLSCSEIGLGRCGTALWVQPRESSRRGLTYFDVHSSEVQSPGDSNNEELLVGTVFPGPLDLSESKEVARTIWVNESGGNWVSMDYAEELGVVALGSSDGHVTVLMM